MSVLRLLTAVLVMLAACPLSGQVVGQGLPSSLGVVPTIEVQHLAVSQLNNLIMRGFSPGSSVSLLVAFSATATPLANFGYGPAVIGPDPASPNGATLFGGFVADANGEVFVPFTGQQGQRHWTVHLQAWAADPGAPWGAAISRHVVVVFGNDREKVPLAVDAGAGRETLIEAFAYGALAMPSDPRLTDLQFLPVRLATSNEMGFARDDRPTQAVADHPESGLQLVGGDRLFHAQQANGKSGFFIERSNGSLDVLVWAQGSLLLPAFLSDIAVSAHDPYAAFRSENALPEYGNGNFLLARTDGMNIPGSHRDWIAVPTPGGYEVEATSICFLAGAVIFGDGETRLDRLDLQTFTVTPVVLPPSGGQTPVYVDEVCAVAADGSLLAIGAGLDKNLHDVYIVDAQGLATNLTNLPADYEDAGPGQADGMQMAVSDDGGLIAYMRTVTENELFVKGSTPGALEIQVTHAGQYINSIDTVVGLGFKTGAPKVVFAAGKSDIEVDAYDAQIPGTGPVTQITNLSGTSGFNQPVFGLGSTLTPRRVMGTVSGRLLEFANTAGPDRLQVVGATSSLALDVVDLAATSPVAGDVVIVDQPLTGSFRLRAVNATSAQAGATFTTLPGSSLSGFFERGGMLAMLTDAPGGSAIALYDPAGLQTAAGPSGIPEGGLHVTAAGEVMAIVRDPLSGIRRIEAFDRSAATWSPVTIMNAGTTMVRFLR